MAREGAKRVWFRTTTGTLVVLAIVVAALAGTAGVDDFSAGVDNLVIGMGTDFTRYDFGA